MSEQIWVTDALVDPEQVYHFDQPEQVAMRNLKKRLDLTYQNAEFADLEQNLEEKAILTRVTGERDRR
ncbi:MAG: hypothetical protein Tsb0020_51510 [Haliangiales bacterium]